ncbi:MAG: DUF1622 domain-containing protein [Lentimicrobiaceae bacterium]|jgi:uncharacterized membrane protein|nr:DUF1622 domain-containing protein [Lentimicrobiaceae bacterium]MCP4910103.1 DUF1622 domain-containing protein [Bacteroidota bacterium]MBT3453609.1 DUF1622 domain-containing protein [Lentimicrobiaceae bacterium]MBT3817781.1 DUF1622 domain-containing protein [Lentimicrobiaceae bacterium]MBT4061107.1 DUF1622 domain-containing protein [Lentimicrobiaceae bacterium]
MENIKVYIEYVSNVVEAVGVITIFIGIIYSLIRYLISLNKHDSNTFINLRHNIGKSILLGLEILIAADIMGTVVTDPTLDSVFVLGIIVIIRTVLSLSLQVELDGKFPWQRSSK